MQNANYLFNFNYALKLPTINIIEKSLGWGLIICSYYFKYYSIINIIEKSKK